MEVIVEAVNDLDAAWPELEPLFLGLHQYHVPLTGVRLLPDWSERQKSHIATGDDAIVLVARRSGRIVGFANGRFLRNPGIFEDTFGYIDNMYVVPEARATGVGRALLSRFQEWAVEKGAAELRLNVAAANELGRAVWKSTGFEPLSLSMKKRLRLRSQDLP